LNILITASVTAATTICQDLGSIRLIDDQALVHADLTDIDVVIMRSQSRLNLAQVKGTRVKFIGTATAGWDHLPVQALQQLGIYVAQAKGCNANSVADYWLSALLTLPRWRESMFQGKVLGIIGYGAVGQAVAKRAQALGFSILVNDPPRQAQPLPIPYPCVPLKSLLIQADVVSVHVPLVQTQPWPTQGLIDAAHVSLLKPGTVFINTARGEVCDSTALVTAKTQGKIAELIVDVWPQEPMIDKALWQAATLATPHIAGHSYVGKWQGTWQIYEALMHWLGRPVTPPAQSPWPAAWAVPLTPPSSMLPEVVGLWHYVQQVYDIQKDHDMMQRWFSLPANACAQAFTAYRRDYPLRSELSLARVSAIDLTPWQQAVLLSAGVTLC